MKNNSFKRSGSAVRARLRCSDITKESERSLCKRDRLITASTLRLAAFLESANGALVALLETLRRCHGDLTPFLLRFYQNTEPRRVLCAYSNARRRMAFYNVLGDPTTTNEDAFALLRRCRRLYCVYLGVLHYLRTQRDRREDAAPV